MNDSLKLTLSWMAEVLSDATPRLISTGGPKQPVLLYTDGSCEGAEFESAHIGALLMSPGSRP
eukprot:6437960-Amphidinium_carterae.1